MVCFYFYDKSKSSLFSANKFEHDKISARKLWETTFLDLILSHTINNTKIQDEFFEASVGKNNKNHKLGLNEVLENHSYTGYL